MNKFRCGAIGQLSPVGRAGHFPKWLLANILNQKYVDIDCCWRIYCIFFGPIFWKHASVTNSCCYVQYYAKKYWYNVIMKKFTVYGSKIVSSCEILYFWFHALSAIPVTSTLTQWCAFQISLSAFTPFYATLLAFARDKLYTDLWCIR